MNNVNLANTRYDLKETGKRIDKLIEKNKLKVSNICSSLPDGGLNPNKHLTMTRQTLSKAIKGNAELSFNQLLDICNFFGCSMSYLLCEVDYSSKQKEMIGKWTGLSEKAIDILSEYNNTDDRRKLWSDYLNHIICHDKFKEMFGHISELAGAAKVEGLAATNNDYNDVLKFVDDQTAQLWYISQIFTSILEDLTKKIRLENYNKKQP